MSTKYKLVLAPYSRFVDKYGHRYKFGNGVDMIKSRRYKPQIPYYVYTKNKTTIGKRMMVV
jgi:hypothetical protein